MSPADAEMQFLEMARRLDMYGFELFEARDGGGRTISVGVNCNGVSVFEAGLRLHSFPWAAIIKLSFKRRHFLLQLLTTTADADGAAVSDNNCGHE